MQISSSLIGLFFPEQNRKEWYKSIKILIEIGQNKRIITMIITSPSFFRMEQQDLENAYSDSKKPKRSVSERKKEIEDISKGIEMELNGGDLTNSATDHAAGYRTFKEVSDIMSKKFNNQENIHSTALDIVSFYLKGQKILHVESKLYCEYYLYRLMLPAIFISTLSSVVSGILKDSVRASVAVCILTAANSFILALVTYLKLDAKSEAHRISAYSFEKLQSLCEFKSGKILLTKNEDLNKLVSDFLEEIEDKYKEIKESNQFIIPETIQLNYPFLYYTNIFSELKIMRNQEMIQINKLKVVMNQDADIQNALIKVQSEIERIQDQLENKKGKTDEELVLLKQQLIDWQIEEKELNIKREIHYLEKNKAIEHFLDFRNEYYTLNNKFNEVIKTQNAKIKKSNGFNLCACLKT